MLFSNRSFETTMYLYSICKTLGLSIVLILASCVVSLVMLCVFS